jgi:clan AA aspartic protease
MILGRTERLHALLPVRFRLENRPDVTIEFIVDTGFTGSLSLPAGAISALGLPYLEEISANLANDADIALDVHAATIHWNETEQDVRVLATGRRPLLGTALLAGHELTARFVNGGAVTVEAV